RLGPRVPGWAGLVAGAGSFGILLVLWASFGEVRLALPWIPSAGIGLVLRLDPLSLLFALIVTGMGALIFGYSATYMARERVAGRFYVFMALFMGAMVGLVLAGDLILLFLFWELTTIASFFLIGLERGEKRSTDAALKALLLTGLGGIALLLAFLGLATVVGSFDLEVVLAAGSRVTTSGLYLPILLLFVVAVLAKSAQFPFHIWLPDAMVAPTPVSAYLHSAAMVKAGIFLLALFVPLLATDLWVLVLLPIGVGTMILGGLQAIRSTDLKRILAYSTISQLGLLASSFALATALGEGAGLLHTVNHAVMKGALFLVAGAVILATGMNDIRELGGLRRGMPLTAIACALAALSLAGVPPLGGFLSKEAFFEATLEGAALWVAVLAVIGGGLTFAYAWNFFARLFLGPPRTEVAEPKALAVPALILGALALTFGIYPGLITGLISGVLPPGEHFAPSLLVWNAPAALMSLLSALLGVLLLWRYAGSRALLQRVARGVRLLTPNRAYGAFVGGVQGAGRRIALAVQNGSLRRYSLVLLLGAAAALLLPLIPLLGGPFLIDTTVTLPGPASIRTIVLAIVLLTMIVFAVLAAILRTTLHAVLSLSGMGFLLAMAFMLFNAPDLAMTQVLVELVFLVIFLIVIYKLPLRAIKPSRRRRASDLLLAIGILIGVTAIVNPSLATFAPGTSVGEFYLDPDLVNETGGTNVVNVVITDFRGFDTLGEISVIALASLGLYTLFRRMRRG
ncbi:MAG: hydrogen gas-evolving membrane-bound hydrogenase subunit E, partial [Thermoplasmata archaeon]|nr:hydrogen gas-evolving membrane-bound hydrogenase subunit E [Thermoplasmata archaeon]